MQNKPRRFGAAIPAGLWAGIKQLADGIYRHDCVGLAAQISYSFLFSLFPFLLFLRALVAYFPGAGQIGDAILRGLADLISTESRLYQIVEHSVFNEIDAVNSALLSIGIVLTIWSASGAIMTLIKATNRAYGLEETRPWHRRRLMAAGLAVVGAILIPVGALLLFFGSWIGSRIATEFGSGSLLHLMWLGLRWPVVILASVLLVGLFMRVAPSRRQRWYAILPGATFTVAAIIGTSIGLSWFLTQNLFHVRWLTYGAIGTAIVLLFWAFISGLMVLVGGEINAVVGRAVEKRWPPQREGEGGGSGAPEEEGSAEESVDEGSSDDGAEEGADEDASEGLLESRCDD